MELRDKEIDSMGLRPRLSFLFAATAVTCGMAARPAPGDDRSNANDRFTVRKGLLYCEADRALRLDLFVPKETGCSSDLL